MIIRVTKILPLIIFAMSAIVRAQTPTDPLVTLNNALLPEYNRAKTEALSKTGPVIICEGGNVVLLRNGKRTEAQLTPPIYHSLKAVAHIPFAIFLMFDGLGADRLTDERVAQLQHYRELIIAARASLGGRGFDARQLQRQQKIISDSITFFDSVVKKRQLGKGELDKFANEIAPLLLANVDEAAQAELNALHSAVTTWRKEMSDNEWNRLHVVVISAHMPREGEVTTQYFMKLLNEPIEGRRIIFAEGLWEEPKALDLLGIHLVDGSTGAAFFGDYMRMHRDLLADSAKVYIETKLFP